MTARIIPFPVSPAIARVCSNCDNFYMNRVGHAFCHVFGHEIINEAADDCEAFDNPEVEARNGT